MSNGTKTIGILTSGGDCPGLNAAIRGVTKAANKCGITVIGINNGYRGLIEGDVTPIKTRDVYEILTKGGTILGTSREKPFKRPKGADKDAPLEKVLKIKENYQRFGFECIIVLGGNGSHKTSAKLQEEGINVIGLPKTIDNDIYGTDITFGFHTAVDIATDAIDRIHSTAQSHDRVMIVEVMGHKVGWMTLYSGVAGAADAILLPEIPYSINSIVKHINKRKEAGRSYSVIAVAEGAKSIEEKDLKNKQIKKRREKNGYPTVGYALASQLDGKIDQEVRVSVLGYQQRGGAPSPYDRILSTEFGTAAVDLINAKDYGKIVVRENGIITSKPLSEIAGKLKTVPSDLPLIDHARKIDICFGD